MGLLVWWRSLVQRRRAVLDLVPRCQFVSPTPWGASQCALTEGHDGRHGFSPRDGGP